MGWGDGQGYFDDSAPDETMVAQGMLPNPFPAQATQQNAMREFQNLADSASKPGNSRVYNEGKSKPLFNAVTDFAGGGMSSNDLQALFQDITGRATKSRQALDMRNRNDLTSLDSFAKILGDANVEDVDGLAQAVLMHKAMSQASTEYDKHAQQGAMSEMVSGLMGKQDSRIAHQSYLNSKGIQEFGAPGKDGNYMALDSWQAIGADRDKQRQEFQQKLQQDMTAGLMAHVRAQQTAQQAAAMQQAMAMGSGAMGMRKQQAELELLPKEAASNMAYKDSMANPGPGRQLTALAQILKANPELADQIDPSALFGKMGIGKKPEAETGMFDKIRQALGGGQPAEAQAGQTKNYPGSEPVLNDAQHSTLQQIMSKPPKERDQLLAQVAKKLGTTPAALKAMQNGRK